MSATPTQAATPDAPSRLIAGPLFRHVIAFPIQGHNRHRVLAVVAALADTGVAPIRVADVVAQAPRLNLKPAAVKAITYALVNDGHLRIRRGVITLNPGGGR